MSYWWEAYPEERFWVEIRKIPGIGEEVYSDILNKKHRPDPYWALVRTLRAGQVVFHYDADQSRFVGYSTVSSDAATVGTQYRAPLENFRPIDRMVGLERLQEISGDLARLRDIFLSEHRGPLFLPFQFTEDPSRFRMLSRYFAKFPIAVIQAIFGEEFTAPLLSPQASAANRIDGAPGGFLKPFRLNADLRYRVGDLKEFKPKSDSSYKSAGSNEEALRSRSHETLVNDCARWLSNHGFSVGRNAAIDLGIVDPSVIIEAKIMGNSWNEVVRAGISQLYEYRYFKIGAPTSALALLVDAEPPGDWLKYLELDRGIGVIWKSDDGFEMSKLASEQIFGTRPHRRRK